MPSLSGAIYEGGAGPKIRRTHPRRYGRAKNSGREPANVPRILNRADRERDHRPVQLKIEDPPCTRSHLWRIETSKIHKRDDIPTYKKRSLPRVMSHWILIKSSKTFPELTVSQQRQPDLIINNSVSYFVSYTIIQFLELQNILTRPRYSSRNSSNLLRLSVATAMVNVFTLSLEQDRIPDSLQTNVNPSAINLKADYEFASIAREKSFRREKIASTAQVCTQL